MTRIQLATKQTPDATKMISMHKNIPLLCYIPTPAFYSHSLSRFWLIFRRGLPIRCGLAILPVLPVQGLIMTRFGIGTGV